MAVLFLKVFVMWSLVATVSGMLLGAAIGRGERVRKEEFMSCVFESLEAVQTTRS